MVQTSMPFLVRTPSMPYVSDLYHRRKSDYVDPGFITRGHLSFDWSIIAAVNVPSLSTQDDLARVAAMARGEESAASALYDRHSAVMYGLALRMVGEVADAEEVVLDAFAQAWRDASRYDTSRGTVVGWLTTITRTRALDLIRARGRRARMNDTVTTQLDEPAAMGEGFRSPDLQVDDADRASAVTSALGELPEAQRRAIELAFFEGLTHPEVAERLREPLGTVKTRIRLGMQKLRDMLAGMAPEGAS